MFTHNEVTALLFLVVAVSSGGACLLAAHWWWPSRQRLDDEYDDGYDRGWEDRSGQMRQDALPEPPLGEDRAGEDLASGQEHAAEDGDPGILLPRMPGLALDQPAIGSTISAELTMLGFQDELDELLSPVPVVDPDWHPSFLARSEAWLADTRAQLGLVTA